MANIFVMPSGRRECRFDIDFSCFAIHLCGQETKMKGVLIKQFQPFGMYQCQAAQLMWSMSPLRALVPLGPSECSLAVALYKVAQWMSTYQLIQSDGGFGPRGRDSTEQSVLNRCPNSGYRES